MTYQIKGFLETSFVDWDGKVSAVIFMGGCNFRCPFCHNVSLVIDPDKNPNVGWAVISEYLETHRDWLDGVCITGGEPTIWPNLKGLIQEIKKFKLPVKLDTNGSRPEVVSELISEGLIDYVALDYKAPLDERYYSAAGLSDLFDIAKIRQSIKILLASRQPVEFRITVVPGFIDEDGLRKMARDLLALWQESEKDRPVLIGLEEETMSFRFVLQQFKPANALDKNLRLIKPFSNEQMFKFERIVSQVLGRCYLR